MKTYAATELKTILNLHRLWLSGDFGGERAYLQGADLTDAKLPDFSLVPEEGDFIGFKSVRLISSGSTSRAAVLKLLIPADAQRTSSLVGRKCRASAAKVVAVVSGEGTEFVSSHDNAFVYRLGETVTAPLNADIRVECATGIYFFMTRKEADEYGR